MIRLGIIGAADIAYKRFLPALAECTHFKYVGVASTSGNNSKKMMNDYGGEVWDSYDKLITNSDVDAIYIALPPALHFEWAKKAIQKGKHVLLEKPFTISQDETVKLISYAREKGVVVCENYSFIFHEQIEIIKKYINSNKIGAIRHYDIRFGFPRRAVEDFRYSKQLGGGALLDCGGYTIKLASLLLGNGCRVIASSLHNDTKSNVNLYGNSILVNEKGQIANIAFGMDNEYICSLEVWGSEGLMTAPRIFTAPSDFSPVIIVKKSGVQEIIHVTPCNQFTCMIQYFGQCMKDVRQKNQNYENIIAQSKLVDEVMKSNIKYEDIHNLKEDAIYECTSPYG